MKLIDADALAAEVASWKRQQHSMNIDYSTGYRCALSAVEGMIAEAPAIDAIPVEWLREKMKIPTMTCANPFDYVFCEWMNRGIEYE